MILAFAAVDAVVHNDALLLVHDDVSPEVVS